MEEHVDVQINYYKEEIEIRAESLKIEIDKIKDTLIKKFDKIKGCFKYLIYVSKLKKLIIIQFKII
jgi:hypothetical protein